MTRLMRKLIASTQTPQNVMKTRSASPPPPHGWERNAPHARAWSTRLLTLITGSPAIYLRPLHLAPHGERHGGGRAMACQWNVTNRGEIMELFLKIYTCLLQFLSNNTWRNIII